MAPADGYVGVDAPRQFFVNVSSLVLFRSDPAPFTILGYGPLNGPVVDFFNTTHLDYGPGFGVDVELGGLFGDSNVGFLAGGFATSPFAATYEAPIPGGALIHIDYGNGAGTAFNANSLLATGETSLRGFDANLMFQLAPSVAAYAGVVSLSLDDVLVVSVTGAPSALLSYETGNAMVGGQVGLRLSLGDHSQGSLFLDADFRFGALRNAISQVGFDDFFSDAEATDTVRTMMFGSDVTLGLQLNESVALTLGLRYLQLRGVDLASDFLSEFDPDGTEDTLYLFPPNLVPFSVHGATLGLTIGF